MAQRQFDRSLELTLLEEAAGRLGQLLPAGWSVAPIAKAPRSVDSLWEVTAADGTVGLVAVEAKVTLTPRSAARVAEQLRAYPAGAWIVVSPYLSPRSRERLSETGTGYIDLTGNSRLILDRPGLFIKTDGAVSDPNPLDRPARSLKGAKAGRLVRALCDYREPMTLGALADKTGIDPGYASRMLNFLVTEDLITRPPRGPVQKVSWDQLLKRWAIDYSVLKSNGARSYIAARGIQGFVDALKRLDTRYAVTGSLAAAQLSPTAPPRLALCYVESQEAAAERLDLTRADAGSNVVLLVPRDEVVYERTRRIAGLEHAAASQVAVDLLTSPGRGPVEAEGLLAWMAENEDEWRT